MSFIAKVPAQIATRIATRTAISAGVRQVRRLQPLFYRSDKGFGPVGFGIGYGGGTVIGFNSIPQFGKKSRQTYIRGGFTKYEMPYGRYYPRRRYPYSPYNRSRYSRYNRRPYRRYSSYRRRY